MSDSKNVSLASFFGGNSQPKVVKVTALAKTTVSANPVQTNRKGSRYKGKQIAVPQPEMLAKNTLDATHKSRMKHFKEERKSVTSKKKEVLNLTQELQTLNNTPAKERDFRRIVVVEECLEELQKEIQYIPESPMAFSPEHKRNYHIHLF